MKHIQRIQLAAASLVVTSVVQAQPIEADWLYFSPGSSWVSASASLINETTLVQLPVRSLTADQFWWQASQPQTQLQWSQPDVIGLPKKDDPVEIQGESGLWLVRDVYPTHLVLQKGRDVRYWPQSQWHLLNWTSATDYGLSLSVLQPNNSKGTFFYAWNSADISAEVRYRLEENDDKPMLYQELLVSNLSDSDYKAEGYSFAQSAGRPVVLQRTTMALSMESDSAVSAPESGQSQGIPTLVSKQPITLAASSHVWLPVSQTPLSAVERTYQINWDSRQQGLQNAQSQLILNANRDLPDISGAINIGVFDQQIALLQSYYSPSTARQATLNMGQNPMVSLNSRQTAPGRWLLEFSNRTDDNASVELMVSHWDGKTNQRVPMTVRIDKNSTKKLNLELNSAGLMRIAP